VEEEEEEEVKKKKKKRRGGSFFLEGFRKDSLTTRSQGKQKE
jgi:hypothetical protein